MPQQEEPDGSIRDSRGRHRRNIDEVASATGGARIARGFFYRRVGVRDLDFGDSIPGLERYPDYIPGVIAAVISTGKASLHELSTSLSVEDCYMLMDIAVVDGYNQRVAQRYYAEKKN